MRPFRWLVSTRRPSGAATTGGTSPTPPEPSTPPQLPDPNRPTAPELWLPQTYLERAGPPPPPPGVDVSGGPDDSYSDSEEHLWDELCRIDQLIRAQTLRWRAMIASKKPEQLWGMVQVTEAEVDAYLGSECAPPYMLSEELDQLMRPYWERAADFAEKIASRLARTPLTTPLYVERLRRLFDLSDFERDILLVCLFPELDARIRRLFGYLQDDASRTRPNVELVLQILQPEIPYLERSRDVFDSSSTLMRNHLLTTTPEVQPEEPLPMRMLRVDDRIANFLLGIDRLDAALTEVVSTSTEPLDWGDLVADNARITELHSIADLWVLRRAREGDGLTAFFHGRYGSGRLAGARAICTATGTPLLIADAGAAMRSSSGFNPVVDLAYREATLRGAALYWSNCDKLLEAEQLRPAWERLMWTAQAEPRLTFLASSTDWEPSGVLFAQPVLRVDFLVPNYGTRVIQWLRWLPPSQQLEDSERETLARRLANAFRLTGGQIADAVATAHGLALRRDPRSPQVSEEDLFEGCRRQSGRQLITMATHVPPTNLTFDNLVVPRGTRNQLEELRARIAYRSQVLSELGFERRLTLGKGLLALFAGPPGGGKTFTAGLLANEHGMDLYKINLPAVVSKYVGETEKNLNRIFDEAEDAGVILFFDEADALFGKRAEVKEAQDRWANMETNFLLQKVEEFQGVVILASNLSTNMDEAFKRRMDVLVEFPFPDASARLQILEGMFPAGVPHPTSDELAELATRFPLSGGSLQNVIYAAAFRALARSEGIDPTISMEDLVLSIAREYQKYGWPMSPGVFGERFYPLVRDRILSES